LKFVNILEFRSHEAEIEHKAFRDESRSSEGVTFGPQSHYSHHSDSQS